jgi:hypothetical protein
MHFFFDLSFLSAWCARNKEYLNTFLFIPPPHPTKPLSKNYKTQPQCVESKSMSLKLEVSSLAKNFKEMQF